MRYSWIQALKIDILSMDFITLYTAVSVNIIFLFVKLLFVFIVKLEDVKIVNLLFMNHLTNI